MGDIIDTIGEFQKRRVELYQDDEISDKQRYMRLAHEAIICMETVFADALRIQDENAELKRKLTEFKLI